MGERVLVTGGSGFIGSSLVEALLERGAEVHCLFRAHRQAERPAHTSASVRAHFADLTDRVAVQDAVDAAQPDAVVHLAAVGVQDVHIDPVAAVQVNVVGTLNLLQALQGRYRVFVNTGTCLEYGSNDPPFREDQDPRPELVYAISKTAAWRFCRHFHQTEGWPIVTVRPFGVYGPRQPTTAFVPLCIEAARRGQAFQMSPGDQTRDWVYISDVADGFLRALSAPQAIGGTFNLCSGIETTLYDLALAIITQMGSRIAINRGSQPYRDGEIRRLVGDNSRAQTVLGWAPRVSLAEGLRLTIEAIAI
jgi:UDP-glucose 4-epimerase